MKYFLSIALICSISIPAFFHTNYDVLATFNQSNYTQVDVEQIRVTADYLNIRSGPSIQHQIIGELNRGDIVDVLGTMDDWFVINLPDQTIGLVSSEYVSINVENGSISVTAEPDVIAKDHELTSEENALIDILNSERESLGIPTFEKNLNLCFLAKEKALDLVNHNQFSHQSPNHGFLDEMLNKKNITYKLCGENICGNVSIEDAHKEIMSSENHAYYIAHEGFNQIGVAVIPDSRYGKLIIELFISE